MVNYNSLSTVQKTLGNKKYVLFLLPIIFLASALSVIGWQIAIGLALFLIFYILANQHAWLLMILAPLGLLLGTIINLEIRPNWIYEISLGEICVMAAFATLILDTLFNIRQKKLLITKTGWFLIIYLLFATASIVYIRDYELYVAGLKVLVLSIMAYVSAVNLLETKLKVKALLYSLVFFVGILATQIFYILLKAGFSPAIFFDRSSITLPFGPLALVAAMLAFLLPLIFSLYFEFNKKSNVAFLSLLIFGLGAIAVFVSLGKAAAMSLVIGLLFLFWRFKEQRIIITLSLLFFITVGSLTLTPYVQGFWERFTRFSIDTTTTFRVEEYKVARQIITDHPLFGIGVGEQLNQYRRLLHPEYGQLANNYMLQAGMDLGIIGMFLYLCIIISVLVLIISLNRKRSSPLIWGITAAVFAAGINGLFEVTVFAFQYAIIFWLVIGLARHLRLGSPNVWKN